MCQRQSDLQEKRRRAAKNREYVRRLLAEKQPAFAAALRAAERQLEWERSVCGPRLCGLDYSRCDDAWSASSRRSSLSGPAEFSSFQPSARSVTAYRKRSPR
jgi:hypothetical protein